VIPDKTEAADSAAAEDTAEVEVLISSWRISHAAEPLAMWRPPERIKHNARGGTWPTAAEAAASLLFSPVEVGPLTLTQRTWVPAMVPWRASEDGFVTPEVLEWYECFARGQPGAIVVEATGIRDVPSGPLLRAGHDRFLARPAATSFAWCAKASGGQTRSVHFQLIDFLIIRRKARAIAIL